MAEEVKLPELGESVTEGVITAWLVEVGDEVEVDQALAEISTDKVDTEIPSPVAGTVQELLVAVDDTVEPGQTLAVIGDEAAGGEAKSQESGEQASDKGEAEAPDTAEADGAAEADASTEEEADSGDATADDTGDAGADSGGAQAQSSTTRQQAPAASPQQTTQASPADGQASSGKALLSPLVRKMLREAGISSEQVQGSGPGGRITREDAERAVAQGPSGGATAAAPPVPPTPAQRERPEASPVQVDFGGQREVTQDLSRVRKAIARAMHQSLQTTAQLTAAVEVDVTAIMNLRAHVKDAFKSKHGASLSPLPLIARAVCMTIPRHPAINSSIDMESGTANFRRYINLGIAVDTERGLLVPNIKDAQDLTVPGIATQIGDLARKTRSGKGLSPDDIQGGTFTITNTGSRGTLFDTPVLNPPEVGILATCAIEKRPVVISDEYGDSIAIRWMTYLCLTYDHRMVDGADAARFLQDLKWVIETHDFAPELGI